ncbi:MAG: extracellular solute-binding protein [bacterium]|nr:extracellular solute-binding protein [bacterium]
MDGKTYMLTMANTAYVTYVNASLIERVGMRPFPEGDLTYEEILNYFRELKSKLPEGSYSTVFYASSDAYFDSFIRQYGYEYISPDGKQVGFPKEVLKKWGTLWKTILDEGLCPPPEVMVEDSSKQRPDKLFTHQKIAVAFENLNQAKLYQRMMEDVVEVQRLPIPGDAPHKYGESIVATGFSIPTTSKYKEQAADVINWILHDQEAQKVYKMEHGATADPEIAKMILADLDPSTHDDRLLLQEVKLMQDIAATAVPTTVRNEHTPALVSQLKLFNDRILFGQLTIDEAVDQFYKDAETALK